MNYEIVWLSGKSLTGITKRVVVETPPMELWEKFYTKAISRIEGKLNTKAYGVYYDFDSEGCTAMVACKTDEDVHQQEGITQYRIPEGKYAKFCIKGEVHQVVPAFWQQIDQVGLKRSYQCDFEVFPSSETKDVVIEIYVSILDCR